MTRCPTEDQLRRLLAERLDADECRSVEAHIEACSSCHQTLARLGDDTDARTWRSVLGGPRWASTNGAGEEPSWCPAAIGPPPPDADVLDAGPPGREGGAIRFPGPPRAPGHLGQVGPYQVIEELGRGATGIVFRAYDDRLRRPVALKVLRPELAAVEGGRDRFDREAWATVAVQHRHVVAVHHVGDDPAFPLPYLVMEYVEGESLGDRLRRQGALPPPEAARIVREVALGLEQAHRKGVVHRDVKPSNILLDGATGRAKLTDFGIARVIDELDEATRRWLTASGHPLGSPSYMSPEQILDPRRVGPASDV
ncbi:MAG TPA: serine/threonine-protein kinase, partial [Isosphaeraceae bacterium]